MGMIETRSTVELRRLYYSPGNRKLRIGVYVAIGAAIIIIVVMTGLLMTMDEMPAVVWYLLKIAAGLCALTAIILEGTLRFRVSKAHIEKWRKKKGNQEHA